MSITRLRALLALLLLALPLPAQEPLDPESGLVFSLTELVVEPVELENGWLELTPLAEGPPASLVRLEDRSTEDGELRLEPGVPAGAAMLCTGGKPWAVLCEQVFVEGSAWVEPGQSADVAVRFEPGIAVKGRYQLDSRPIVGARVAVVPAGLQTGRGFTMPLGVQGRGTGPGTVVREILSDEDGRFLLPRLASGEYFLETLLPSGRLHRTEPFELPGRDAARRQAAVPDAMFVVWDLGEIDVADGLTVSFQVTDAAGSPLPGARVAARQGDTPETLLDFEATADREGQAHLSGFSAEHGAHVSCRMPGYRTHTRQHQQLPVLVTCALEPLAAVRGEVIGLDALPVAGAMVSVEAMPEDEPRVAAATREAVEVGVTGRYNLRDLAAGEYRLTAAAPGFTVEHRTLTVEPGERLELETIVLLPGREIEGRVVDAETGEGIEQVEIRAAAPPGAVSTVTGEGGAFILATGTDEDLVLRLEALEHATREVTVAAERLAEREPLRFEMARAGWIRAVVWDEATDLPCQGCRLVVRPGGEEIVTDGYGVALSEPLAAGIYRVHRPRVSHLGSKVVERDDAEMRQVRVPRGKAATVRFGERRSSVRVRFEPSPGAGTSLVARTTWRAERSVREADGDFAVRHRRGESLNLYLVWYDPAAGAETQVRQATLPGDYDAADLVLPLPSANVRGRASSAGQALVGETVRLVSLAHAVHASARTRPDGSFAFPHLPPGVYNVVIGERNVRVFSLRDRQSLDLGHFELFPGSF
ncbi:MAG: carboxypeptidase regulatory-like domain-containing protein [bacterium]|nr:carboxypeptidase regulatory-like domain-containing protein [bacterium]